MKRRFCLALCLFLSTILFSSGCGEARVEGETEAVSEDSLHTSIKGQSVKVDMTRDPKNLSFARVKGYRVQIFTGSSRDEAIKAKALFIQKFPDIDNYLEYEVPNYKVRVGDFLSRWQAKELCAKINKTPVLSGNAFVVPSLVNAELPKPEQDTVPDSELVYYTLIDSTGKEVQIPVLKSSLSKEEVDSIEKIKNNPSPKTKPEIKEKPVVSNTATPTPPTPPKQK